MSRTAQGGPETLEALRMSVNKRGGQASRREYHHQDWWRDQQGTRVLTSICVRDTVRAPGAAYGIADRVAAERGVRIPMQECPTWRTSHS